MNQSKFCRNCGGPLNENDKFCNNCGAAVSNQQESTNLEQQMNNQETQESQVNNIPQNNMNNSGNYPNAYPNYAPNNSKDSWKYIIISIVLIALIGVGIYFLFIKGGSSSDNPGGSNTPTDKSGSDTTNNNNNNNNNNNKNNNNNNGQNTGNTDVAFKGFTFKIPSNYKYEVDGDTLSFGNENDTWYSGVQVIQGDYNLLVAGKDQITSSIGAMGYQINTITEKVYSGMDCLVMETSGMGYNMIMAYVKATSSKVFVVTVLNLYEDYDYSLFEETIKILKTAV